MAWQALAGGTDVRRVLGGSPWLTAAIPMENPYCSCKAAPCCGSLQADMNPALGRPRNRSMYMFGGCGFHGDLQDLWRFDYAAESWESVWTGGHVGGWPTDMMSHHLARDGGGGGGNASEWGGAGLAAPDQPGAALVHGGESGGRVVTCVP